MSLDHLETLSSLDAEDMCGRVHDLPDVLEAAYARGEACRLPLSSPTQLLVCGMGGSAISGDVVRTWALPAATCAVTVHRGDGLPAHAGASTLACFLSYSGNTGETLGALREALARGVPSVVVTSGGEAARLAGEAGVPVVSLPGAWQPRAAMGDLLGALLGVVGQVAGFPRPNVAGAVEALRAVRARCAPAVPTAANPAKQLALSLAGKVPFVLGTTPTTEAIATRWKCQLNENAKVTSHLGLLPEFTHNDIVNLSAASHAHVALVALADPADSDFVRRQRGHALDLLAPSLGGVHTLEGEGADGLARQLTLAHMGDWVSVYLGLLGGHDPTPVTAIGELKRRMALGSEAPGALR
ncbi:MAG: bifunctional phosphoglucose/phosphomannose isomerase [Candidatus Sericytochromatia bacterium]|nr:bifunctional phosphoglucose/phosphomannose isomerase [Candidatus Sericytochromatia bacterium]